MKSSDSSGIDLFCGLGGLSLGMKQAGITPILGVDVWPDALVAYKKNFRRASTAEGDLSNRKFQDSLIEKWRGKARFVVGGVPCQSFSMRNKVSRDGSDLPFDFVRVSTALDPEYVIMEEVPNIASMVYPKTKTSYADAVVAGFKRRGYSAEFRILNAADHGVAQSRRRFFLVARRGKHESVFPQLRKRNHIPVSRVISPPYQPVSEYATSLVRSNQKKWAYTVLDPAKPSPTVTTQFNTAGTWNVLETENGYVTIGIKNGLRIQGFPASWNLTDKVTKNYILIGNAVPPPLARAVLSSLK